MATQHRALLAAALFMFAGAIIDHQANNRISWLIEFGLASFFVGAFVIVD